MSEKDRIVRKNADELQPSDPEELRELARSGPGEPDEENPEWTDEQLNHALARRDRKINGFQRGDVVQLIPDQVGNPMFAGCLMTITEPKNFGAQGYVQALGENGEMGGQAYYRAKFEEMEYVGRATMMIPSESEDTPDESNQS